MASSPPNVFTSGTKIVSADVNANFNDVYTELGKRGSNPATFSAHAAVATNTLASNTWTKVICGSEDWDNGGWYDTSTSRFTPQTAGIYRVGGYVQLLDNLDAGEVLEVAVYKNGSVWRMVGWGTSGSTQVSAGAGHCLVSLNGSTDYVELWALQNDPVSRRYATVCYFEGELVRAS